MKRFLIIALCAMLLTPHQADALPRIAEEVIKNREFFAEFTGYEDCYLYDVSRLDAASADDERMGLVLISSQGFEIRLVVRAGNGEAVYKDVIVPEKERREAMRRASLSVVDATRLAKTAKAYKYGKTLD
ncbi:hypothetical protein LJC31_06975 [Synergistaceae bacterium OttesenSCG-928-I11]|nr:hypothetical protein [Synergistaceae bacterium OttesenSCG-928-I11]